MLARRSFLASLVAIPLASALRRAERLSSDAKPLRVESMEPGMILYLNPGDEIVQIIFTPPAKMQAGKAGTIGRPAT